MKDKIYDSKGSLKGDYQYYQRI